MQYNTDLSPIRQAHSAFSTSSTSLPQRPKLYPPPRGTFSRSAFSGPRPVYATSSTPPTSPSKQTSTTKDEQSMLEPAQYTLDDGPRDAPGTAAYYKSWAFRKKMNAGTIQVPEEHAEYGDCVDDSADEDYKRKSKRMDQAKSFIMIFSRTNVRRANTGRKVNERMQRANRRMKFLRKLEGAERFFKWD